MSNTVRRGIWLINNKTQYIDFIKQKTRSTKVALIEALP